MDQTISDLGVIVVAGGASTRYGRNKLLEELGDAPVVVHALRTYAPLAATLVLVAAPKFRAAYEAQVRRYLPDKAVRFADGGDCRAESVRNGLAALDTFVRFAAVHDAARPLGTAAQLKRLYDYAVKHDCGVISGRFLADSLKRVGADLRIAENIARDALFRAETPQLFDAGKLRAALESSRDDSVTDDAEAMRRAGFPVAVLEDPDPNPKLTRPEDMILLKKLFGR
ncbi:MAG: 2-C-methyl-D-erythritol 4-phosphate cytidylyltransferase [Victivallaceae bacterium]|nr:2-C-methyl-D-erythritol 4-phosphate cytidylyltransferase [Victivallaceae bacterium]